MGSVHVEQLEISADAEQAPPEGEQKGANVHREFAVQIVGGFAHVGLQEICKSPAIERLSLVQHWPLVGLE